MIELYKPVVRRSRFSYTVLFSGSRKARPIVVTLLPGDVIEFKEHKRRARFALPLDTAFKIAVRMKAFQDAAEQRRQKKAVRP